MSVKSLLGSFIWTFIHLNSSWAAAFNPVVPTTSEFLETVHEFYPRPDFWPERLTFVSMQGFQLEQLESYLTRYKFRINHACSGRAIDFDEATRFFRRADGDFGRLFAGVLSDFPYFGYEFRADRQGQRFTIGTIHDFRNNHEHPERISRDGRPRKPYVYNWELAEEPDKDRFTLTLKSIDGRFTNTIVVQLIRVVENKEIILRVIEDSDEAVTKAVCNEGEVYQNVMTPLTGPIS